MAHPARTAALRKAQFEEAANQARIDLDRDGYAIVPNILSPGQVRRLYAGFFDWFESVPGLERHHATISPHGIFKYHKVGNAPFMWDICASW